jgi:hypothetical protein
MFFLTICNTFKLQYFSNESVRLRSFPFSLHDKSKAWLKSLQVRSITSFLSLSFSQSFSPWLEPMKRGWKFLTFIKKLEHEKFYESWERFRDLTLKGPHHGFETWRLVQYFC